MRRNRQAHSDYSQNNKIELVRGGSAFFSLMHELIDQATACIHLQFYIFEEDETGLAVKEKLVAAIKRGVKVYMVLDGYASSDISDSFKQEIITAGIRFRWFEPFFKGRYFYFGRRLHQKLLVIDQRHALVGGINISNRYNDLPGSPAWLDWAVHVEGDVAQHLDKVAIDIWRQSRWRFKKDTEPQFNFNPYEISEKGLARVRQNDWIRQRKQVTRSYLEMFKRAQSHIYLVSSYFLPGNIFKKRLARASRRGVKVKILVAGISDVFLSKQAERYMYRWLFRNNVELYEYNTGILHGKVASYDGKWATVGSFNFNYISTYASIELNIDVLDDAIATLVESQVEHIIRNDSKRITEVDYNTRYNFLQKFFQWFCYILIRGIFYITTFYYRPQALKD